MHRIFLLFASTSAFVYLADNSIWELKNGLYQPKPTLEFTTMPTSITWTVVPHTGLAAFRVSIVHDGTMTCNNQTLADPFPAPLTRLHCTVDNAGQPFMCSVPLVMPWQEIIGNIPRIRPPMDVLPIVGAIVGVYIGTILLFALWIRL